MGNDGGSIPTRRELVKEGARDLTTTQVKEIQSEKQEHYWTTCALSHQPLTEPIVSDALGTLYNKDAVLDHLLSESKSGTEKQKLVERGEAFKDRLRSIRDVVEVKFHTSADSNTSSRALSFTCPITNKPLGPGTKAIYLVPCGHVFAESLVSEVPGETCLQCNEIYTNDNIIPILPTLQTDKDRLTQRLEDLKAKGLSHSLKKAPNSSSKKRKKTAPLEQDLLADGPIEAQTPKTTAVLPSAAVAGIRNQGTASLTAKVLKEQGERDKRRKMAGNDNVKSLFSSKNGMDEKHLDFMTRGFSIPANSKR